MKIYLSAQFPRAGEMRGRADDLARHPSEPFAVVSTWHTVPGPADADLTDAERQHTSDLNCNDMDHADVPVIFGDEPGAYGGSGGKFVELGYALGYGIPIIWVGPRDGVFPWRPDVTHCETWPDALAVLCGWQERQVAA